MFVCRQPSLAHMTDRAAMDCGEYSYTRAWKSEIFTAPNLTFAQEVRIAVQPLPGHYLLLRT